MVKDSKLRREYFKEYMRQRREKLKSVNKIEESVNTMSTPLPIVNTFEKLTPKNVNTKPEVLTPNPELIQPKETSPYQQNWHEKYLALEKKTTEIWQRDTETIKRLKKKLKEQCQLNHTPLSEFFQKLKEKIQQEYSPNNSLKCFDCSNYERNYRIMINLLDKYWAKWRERRKVP